MSRNKIENLLTLGGVLVGITAVAAAVVEARGLQNEPAGHRVEIAMGGCVPIGTFEEYHNSPDVSYSKAVNGLQVIEHNLGGHSAPVTLADGRLVYISISLAWQCETHTAAADIGPTN